MRRPMNPDPPKTRIRGDDVVEKAWCKGSRKRARSSRGGIDEEKDCTNNSNFMFRNRVTNTSVHFLRSQEDHQTNVGKRRDIRTGHIEHGGRTERFQFACHSGNAFSPNSQRLIGRRACSTLKQTLMAHHNSIKQLHHHERRRERARGRPPKSHDKSH